MSAVATQNAMPTLSQLHGWRTSHLTDAAARWSSAADTWVRAFGDVSDGLRAPAGTTWHGTASQAAQTRTTADEAGARTVADRLELAVRVAAEGATVVEAARGEALRIVAVAGTLGFDVAEDLSVVDRVPVVLPPMDALRRRQGLLLEMEVKRGAAQLAALDQQIGADVDTVVAGFDALDFSQSPVLPPLDTTGNPGFGQCWSDEFTDDVGPAMVRSAFTGGVVGAVIGGVGGAFFGGPFGAAGGAVLGFVGGAAKGVLIIGPLEAAGKAAWDCL